LPSADVAELNVGGDDDEREDGDGDEDQEEADEAAEFAPDVVLGRDGRGEDEVEGAVFTFAADGAGGHVNGDHGDDADFHEDEDLQRVAEQPGVVDLAGVGSDDVGQRAAVVEPEQEDAAGHADGEEAPSCDDASEGGAAGDGFAPRDGVLPDSAWDASLVADRRGESDASSDAVEPAGFAGADDSSAPLRTQVMTANVPSGRV